MGRGMQMMCKMYGAMDFNIQGQKVRYVWDYHTDEAILEEEMTPERKKLSEIAKWKDTKKALDEAKNKKQPQNTTQIDMF